MAIPFVRALRRQFPHDPLAVLAKPGPASIYRAESSADRVLSRSTFLTDVAALRTGGFDEAWLLPHSFRAALLCYLAGIRERIGFESDRRGLLLTVSLPRPPATNHQLRDYDGLLRAGGIEPDTEPPRLTLPPEAASRAQDILDTRGLDSSRFVLLAPGAAFAWTKRWPAERFGELARGLHDRGFSTAFAVGRNEEEIGARAAQASQVEAPVLGSDLDPVELAALIARARVLIGNDSGPMHLAGAVGTPVVAFFGPTDPGRTAPSGSRSRILDRYVFCSPCYLKECPYGHECMREISVEDALCAVEELLGQSR
jgi:lipopolysaccharide heptosyltransferase II